MIGAGVDPGTVSIDENPKNSPLVLDVPGARERGPQHLDVLAGVVRGAGVLEAVHALDDDRVRRPDAEHQAAVGGGLGRHRLLRHGQRMPRVGRHHRGAELDPAGDLARERQRGQAVEAPRDVRHPAGREPERLGRAGVGEQLVDRRLLAADVADEQPDPHRRSLSHAATVRRPGLAAPGRTT